MSLSQVFLILVALAVVVTLAIAALRIRDRRAGDSVKAPETGLVGATCTAIDFQGGQGRVHLRDGEWPARLSGGGTPVPGDIMRVVSLDGDTLVVRNVSDR